LLAAILTAAGVFLPLRLSRDLLGGIDQALDAETAQLSAARQEREPGFQDAGDALSRG